MLRHETERKRNGPGISPLASRTIDPRRQGQWRNNGNPWRFSVVGKTVAAGCGERRHGCPESKTTSRTNAPSEREAETSTRRNPRRRTAEVGVSQRFLDLSSDCRGRRQKVSCKLLPVAHRADASRIGLDVSEARTTGARSGRRGHESLAKTRLAANKKRASESGSPIVFLDESGFMLQPVRRRTWALSGRTPIQRAWDRHDRLSSVAFIGVSPLRHRLSLFFHLQSKNIDTVHLVWLLRLLHRYYRRRVVLVWDRWNVHKSATAYFEEHHPTWFTFEPLPSYSPELNPVEQCWNHAKYSDLPNFIPDDLDHLYKAVDSSITQQSQDQNLLRSFFAYAKLPL